MTGLGGVPTLIFGMEFLFRPIEAAHLPTVVEDIPTDRPAPLFEDAIIHLNDRVQWPREIIAGWLESIGY